ncbi:MAG: hypothetical protein MSG64_12400 [Pyrinomonadaceae bacterium MAG19_C2-C3]|nr:hypothetical protein [Pyrinomonadaceae bacterium MAG19_C2-C3]
MLLPNGKNAFVDIRKLRDYCLNPDNPRGSNKARVFAAALGITSNEAEFLREYLLNSARTTEVTLGELDAYGQRYKMDFEVITEVGSAPVRSGWIILRGENNPRLTTCYVLKRKRNAEERNETA